MESCRRDLRRWSAKFQSNFQRPYFEGHERPDVVAHRQGFVSYFPQNKNQYYTITNDDQPKCSFVSFTFSPNISHKIMNFCYVLVHDESTFRSGEVSAKRWTVEDPTPFFSKGRGRLHMVSDFIVQHPSGPFSFLSDVEFALAAKSFHLCPIPMV